MPRNWSSKSPASSIRITNVGEKQREGHFTKALAADYVVEEFYAGQKMGRYVLNASSQYFPQRRKEAK